MVPPLLQHGLDFQLHCQIMMQTGIAVLAQATVTDQHASPTPFPDPWALAAVVASQTAGGSLPVPPRASEGAINHSGCRTIDLCGERAQVG